MSKEKARFWYQKAADQGFAYAQHDIAYMYRHGEGGAQSLEQSRVWFKKAAEQGFASAQYQLGVLFDRGYGGPVDESQARYWYEKAAAQTGEQGAHQAAYNLGILLLYGKAGLTASVENAARHFIASAEQGYGPAMEALTRIQFST